MNKLFKICDKLPKPMQHDDESSRSRLDYQRHLPCVDRLEEQGGAVDPLGSGSKLLQCRGGLSKRLIVLDIDQNML